eukprot:5077125-Pyramimonas_sp.AAC.1
MSKHRITRPLSLQGAAWFLGIRGFCRGERDVPTPKTSGRPGVSGLGFLWKISCGRAPTVGRG